ncbi:MAG TPA: sigma-70 family RNA polymerase sigma factor [Thermoanaerobaculia bacterium]|nr:sigma-70 family RNA polymerase sigma factor [Thermoanaerobaculia bacterium]
MEIDDRALVRRMLAGEELAFSTFFETHFPALYRFALARLGKDADAAEEVVQAALARAVTKLATWRGEAALLTWLCTFCRHEISAYLRRRGRAGEVVRFLEEAPEVRAALESMAQAETVGPDEGLLRKELAHLVQLTLDNLPGRYGDALEWKYIDGMSVKEIAARLGLGPKAAESLLTRARQAFREAFTVLWGGMGDEGLDPLRR